jgi:pyruvate formate lyase activating enzyme
VVSVAEVLAEVEADRVFYEESGGGLTLSGGEPAAQPDFARGLLAAARASGLDTCVETCGYGPAEVFESLVPMTGLFLWDLKDTDRARFLASTGGDLQAVLGNLRLVDSLGAPSVLRCILLAGHNLDALHIAGIATVFKGLRHCRGVELLPYHPLGGAKSEGLGRTGRARCEWRPAASETNQARIALIERGIPVVV